MINLTDNQVIAFNRLYALHNDIDDCILIRCKISINTISLIIDSIYSIRRQRFYYIRKNRIECKVYRHGKNKKIYEYKLKKR